MRRFLKTRIDFLLCKPQTSQVLRRLSECYHLLREEELALHCIETACEKDAHDIELKWQQAIIQRQHETRKKQIVLEEKIKVDGLQDITLPTPVQVLVQFKALIL